MSSTSTIELATRTPLPISTSTIFVNGADEIRSEKARNESALPPVDKGFAAWSFLTAAFFVEAIVWGFPNSYGVFLDAYLKDGNYTSQPSAINLLPLIGTVSSGIIYCSSPITYPISSRFPEHRRKALWFGAAILVASLVAASFTNKVGALVALQGISYAIGGTLLDAPTISFMNEWFVARRGLANGIVFAGTAIGGIILPVFFPLLISKYGLARTLRYLAIAVGVLLAPLLPFIKGRLPATSIRGPGPRGATEGGRGRAWMKDRLFWVVLVVNTVQGFGYFVPVIWLPTFASELHISASNASLTLALLNGASFIGRLIMGYLSDKINPWLLAISTLLATSLTTFILWGVLANKFAGLLCFGIVYGAIAGGWSSLFTGFVRPLAKDDPFLTTNIFAYLRLTRGIGNVLSTPISTRLSTQNQSNVHGYESTGFEVGGRKYEKMIIYVGSCFAGAAVIAVAGWVTEGKKQTSSH